MIPGHACNPMCVEGLHATVANLGLLPEERDVPGLLRSFCARFDCALIWYMPWIVGAEDAKTPTFIEQGREFAEATGIIIPRSAVAAYLIVFGAS